MKTWFRYFGIDMRGLSKTEQYVVLAFAFATWITGPVERSIKRGLQIVIALVLTLLASYSAVVTVARVVESADIALFMRTGVPSVVLLTTLASGATVMWLRVGAGALYRIRKYDMRSAHIFD